MGFKKCTFSQMLYCCMRQDFFVVVSNKTSSQTDLNKKGMFGSVT